MNDLREVSPDIGASRVPAGPPGRRLGVSGGGTVHAGAAVLLAAVEGAMTVPGLVRSRGPRGSHAAPRGARVCAVLRHARGPEQRRVASVTDNLPSQRPATGRCALPPG